MGLGLVSPADLCRSYLASFGTGDVEAIAAHVAPGFVNEHTSALGSSCEGIDEYRRRLPGFLASMPGLRYEVEDVIADGGSVAVAYTLHARPDGTDVAVRGMMRFDVADGRIERRVDYWDSQVFLQQLRDAEEAP